MAVRPAGDFDTSYAHDMATIRQNWQWALLILFILALFALPLYASQSTVSLFNQIGISIIAVQGLSISPIRDRSRSGRQPSRLPAAYPALLNVGMVLFIALPIAARVLG
jgi:hypothetical protein